MSDFLSTLSQLSLDELVLKRDALRVHLADQFDAAESDGRVFATVGMALALGYLEVLSARIRALQEGGGDV